MSENNANFILNATENRLKHHNISFSNFMRMDFMDMLSNFTDDDFKEVSDDLTNAIYQKLLNFGVSDIVAYRCSWKWSD